MLSSRSLWVHQRIQALNGRQGFVAVPEDLATLYVAAGWATRVFNPWARPAPPDAPFVDVATLTLTPTPQPVTDASPVGTPAATLATTGGTGPYTYTLSNNDSGNFVIAGSTVNTARTGIAEGAHTVKVVARDSSDPVKWSANTTVTITVTAAAPPEEEEEPEPVAEGEGIAQFGEVASLAADDEANTHVAEILFSGTEPYSITWLDNDGGNFRRQATDIYTNTSPLSVGVHHIALRVTDADGVATEISADIEVTG